MPFDYYAPGMENLFCQMTLMQKAVNGNGTNQSHELQLSGLDWHVMCSL